MGIFATSSKKHSKNKALSKRLAESGNVFLMLFGAVGMVGVLGAATNTVLKGPVKTMSQVTKRTVAENAMIAAGKMSLIVAATQTDNGDCDADGTIEPFPYTTAITGSGGGSIPNQIGASKLDPWGNEYIYCVWDNGITIDDSTCGGSTQNRLRGSINNSDYVLAIISAGPDSNLQTNCIDYIDSSTPTIAKITGADDLILGYTYGEAASISGGLWNLKVGEPETAELSKNISIKDASNTEQFAFNATAGDLQIGGAGKFPTVNTDNLQAFAGAGGTINVDSALASNSNISTSADMSANDIAASGAVTVTGAMSAATLAASGNATVGGTLGVTGATTLAGLTAGTTTLGGTTVSSLTAGTGAISGGALSGSSLGISGTSTLTGNVGIGGAPTTNKLNVTGSVNVDGASTFNQTKIEGPTSIGNFGSFDFSNAALNVTEGVSNIYMDGNSIISDANTLLIGSTVGSLRFGTSNTERITISGTGTINVLSNKITGLANPTSAADATNKSYVDALVGGVTGSNESDPTITKPLGMNKWCYSDGTKVICDKNDPTVAGQGDNLGAGGTTTGNIIMNNSSPTLYFQDTNNRSGMIHQNANLMYFLTGSANNSTAWAVNGSSWPMTINMTNDDITIGGNMNFAEGNLNVGSGSISGGVITGSGSGLTGVPGTAITANSITAGQIAAGAVAGSEILNGSIVATTELSATGTKNSSTFLRGDNRWAVPTASIAGTPCSSVGSVERTACSATCGTGCGSSASGTYQERICQPWGVFNAWQSVGCSRACSESRSCRSCFAAKSQVLMADGTSKDIEDILIGEYLMGGDKKPTRVIAYDRPMMEAADWDHQRLISINGSDHFITNNHPVLTTDGWKALLPKDAEPEAIDLLEGKVTLLEVGDEIILHGNKTEKVESIEILEHKEDIRLYNFVLADDPVFFVNGMAVMSFVPDKAGKFEIHLEHEGEPQEK